MLIIELEIMLNSLIIFEVEINDEFNNSFLFAGNVDLIIELYILFIG